jgi:hypothetical protein
MVLPRAFRRMTLTDSPRWIAACRTLCLLIAGVFACTPLQAEDKATLTLAREANWLIIRGAHLPKGEIKINYLEAYCRAGSTDADWMKHTFVGHQTELVSLSPDGKEMKLHCRVKDGLTVDHVITAGDDVVTFNLTVHNPTDHVNEAQWAQPCVRLGDFAGVETPDPKCVDIKLSNGFIFLNGQLTRLPTQPWTTTARYTPGQVWCPANVPRTDVNPRPLSPLVPSNGLIGCFSEDGKWIFGMAFEPYQELFQGVARCLHSDFRIGLLKPGETKTIRGRIYLMRNDADALLKRYVADWK